MFLFQNLDSKITIKLIFLIEQNFTNEDYIALTELYQRYLKLSVARRNEGVLIATNDVESYKIHRATTNYLSRLAANEISSGRIKFASSLTAFPVCRKLQSSPSFV